jgi:hypothetical protein
MRFPPRAARPSSAESPCALPRRSSESGFAYFLALSLMAIMIIASMTVLMDMRTQGRREREQEMMWRGNQFVSAIKHYYRRTGHYPQNLDDLEKGVANIHFLRQAALVDPMNKDGEGKWRFIYVNPAGQILGSTRYATLQQMAILDLNGGKPPRPPDSDSSDQESDQSSSSSNANCPPGLSNPNAASAPSSQQPAANAPAAGLGLANLPGQLQGMSPGQLGSQAGFGSSFSLGQNQMGTTSTTANTCGVPGALGMPPEALKALMELKPTGPVDSPVIGGMLIGVGSTVERTSVKVYKGGKKYNEWEFIWNPIEEQALALQQGINQAGALGGLGSLGQGIGLPGLGTTSSGGIGSSPIQAPPLTQTPQPSQPQQPQ